MTILLRTLIYISLSIVECRVLHIYGSTNSQEVIANFSNSKLTNYSLTIPQSSKANLKFLTLDSRTGILRAAWKPDCSTIKYSPIECFIQAVYKSNNSLITLESVLIYVDAGDCFVKFSTRKFEGYAVVSRGAKIGTKIFPLTALYRSSSSLDPRFIRLIDQRSRNHFSVDATTGHLLLRESLIGRQERVFNIIVAFPASGRRIFDQKGQPTLIANLQVFVDGERSFDQKLRRTKRRIRNNPPQFTSSYLQANVREDCPKGTTVTTITASDPDSGSNGMVRYSMAASQNLLSQSYFSLNADTGVITTTQTIDREKMGRHYFRVTAKDQGTPPLESSTDLTIVVDDINDNAPVFEKSFYAASIPEDKVMGDFVLNVRARDEDEGMNGEVRYSILNKKSIDYAFDVNDRTGVITVEKDLDREKTPTYDLVIKAEDQGTPPKNATVNVKITLTDINDCYPQFSKQTYRATVREDVRPGTLITTIVATDCDQGTNGEVVYEIVSGNDMNLFSINKINGQLRVKAKLDYERVSVFYLWVSAQDKGRPFLDNQTEVEIILQDVNDNAPEFISDNFKVSVLENVKVGQVFSRVQAIDRDDGSNKDIVYSLIRTDVPFAINPVNGDVSTTSPLDRETNAQYQFGIKATDKGKPSKEGTSQMTVTVLDINDNPPKFSKSEYQASISEKATFGSSVLQVTAKDPDAGQTDVTYSVDRFAHQRCFRMNSLGVISLGCKLDYKKTKFYVFTVRASDGMLDSTAIVYINVTDANTHAPVFKRRSYRGRIKENAKIGTSVLKVVATDDDTGTNAQISYSIERPVAAFAVDPTTGVIKTTVSLDRETKESYQFEVTATDHGSPPLKKKAYVSIRVLDVNDNAPRFLKKKYTATIKEDIKPGERVTQVSAVDIDSGLNKMIQYSFEVNGDGDGAFEMDESQGVIRTRKPLDRETKAVYQLTVLATDKGTPPRQTSATVEVTLEDVRDSPPKFEKPRYEVRINENIAPGTSILQVKAKPRDLIPDTLIIYSIDRNSPRGFKIDPRQGTITTAMELDYETQSVYRLIVLASLRPLFEPVEVIITLTDINDNRPVLENFFMSINVKQDVVPPEAKYRIPAYDPDVSDKLEFDLTYGNERQWVRLNRTTGELSVSPTLVNAMKPAEIGIQVFDGANYANAKGSIMVTSITTEMLSQSLQVNIDDMTVQEFLNMAYDRLIKSISKLLKCSMDQVLLFDIKSIIIKSTTITQDDKTQLTIWMLVRKKDSSGLYNGFFDSHYVRNIIYLHRNVISKEVNIILMPFPDDLCGQKLCNSLPDMHRDCLTYRKFIGDSTILSSPKVVFRTVPVETTFNCTCPVDYRGGKLCDTHLNLCYSNPCGNNGECISVEKGYACLCKPNRSGKNCEVNMTSASCPPKGNVKPKKGQLGKNPCKNSGHCLDDGAGGFKCGCKDKPTVSTPFCELKTRSFKDGDYLAFPALTQKWRVHIKLQFATLQSDAVLLYNGRYNNENDFIALEITNGQVRFTVNTGKDAASAVTNVEGGVNDGTWHTVTAVFKNQTSIVILDDCELGIAVQFGNQEGSYSCAAAKRLDIKKTSRFFDLTGPLLLGGLSPAFSQYPIANKYYTGCLRELYIDYHLLDLAEPQFANGSKADCAAKKDFCSNSPCKRGNCTNTLGTYFCKCPEDYGGKNCEIVLKNKMRFTGDSLVVKDFRTSAIKLPWKQSLYFRTRKARGFLIETRYRTSSGILKISGGKLTYQYDKKLTITMPELIVDDGAWHHVQITWLPGLVKLTADYMYEASSKSSGIQLEFTSQILIGAKQAKNVSQSNISKPFTGCITGIFVDGSQLDFNGAKKRNVYDGCKLPSHCQSSPCSGESTCVEGWDNYKCLCKPGYVGKQCKNVCSFKPCQYGTCVKDKSSAKGFKCLCPREYTGEYCETRMETPCRDKFFGTSSIGLCGPCNCPVGRNFNPVCNKTTGECYCNPNHYRKVEGIGLSNQCYKCNCESIGSLSQQCNVRWGQCPCLKGTTTGAKVIGRRCDLCEDKQSEVTKYKGCVVINTSCPRSMSEDMWWKRGTFNMLARQKCPFGASGTATRYCDQDKGWGKTNLMDCVSNSFLNLRRTLKNLDKKELLWSPEIAMELVRDLDLSIILATRLYPKDIEIALRTITVLFNYESQQNASTLVSAKNHQFAQILFQAASMLFNSDNAEVWNVVQRNSAGTADLMLKMENFSGTLANNLAHLKRGRYRRSTGSIIPPYTVLTPNILMELDPVMIKNFETTLFPPSQTTFAAYSKDWSIVSTRVMLPSTLFTAPGHKVLERNAAVGYMVIRNIGDLLPKSFDAKISDSKYNVEVNSDVVSVRMPGMEDVQLVDPIKITFLNRHVNRSEYICVFWNYSVPNTRGGGWSTNGCRRVAVNWTHTTCACYHMTSFAVLSDLNLEYPPQVAFAMRIVTYIGIAVCIAILLVAFISFMCLRGLKKSNANDIHKNLVASIVLAEVVFLAGINRTEDEMACRIIAILLHYFFSTVFTWMLVEGVHMYRRLSEKRNVDIGRMNFYYFLGWGCPAIVVGISAGLSTDGYGSKHFCWMSTDGALIWTFTIPVMIVVAINTVVFLMAVYMSMNRSKKKRRRRHSYSPHGHDEYSLKAGLRASAILLPLLGVSLVFAILMVNRDLELFHYSFAALTCFQGLFIFLFYCLFDKKVRKEFKNAYIRWKTGDKSYGIPKPIQHFKRSYHPGEIKPVRSPYHYDDDDGGNTSTSEPSSSMPSSTVGTSRPTSEAYSTATGMSIPEDSSVRSAGDGLTGTDVELEEFISKSKARYYPDNPELEKARKMWETPEKSGHSTTNPESSSDEENRNPSPVILTDSSESSGDEQTPNGGENALLKKRQKGATLYASDGPMHSTPMDTTPEEEPEKKKSLGDTDSSDTDEEDKALDKPHKVGPKFTSIPEIIPEIGASGSAATTTSDTPSEAPIEKKPLKSALKKPKAGTYNAIPLTESPITNPDETTPEKTYTERSPEGSLIDHSDKPRSQSSDHKGKKKRGRKHKHGSGRDRKLFVKFKGDRNSMQMSEPSEFI
ncbi:cadherin EGF LAG seven-pass G-type receptor 2-like [Actinia tenebrosa]|uniref:Cadherin EGF LAG seven-pass G-type receptor 2-like n=1 Tax=Actinia tenebrosa TaxID=6105 RepID=A0A6P8I3G5_ACTTE|nr:cadherin EGF LAG seven-pass G-type receptor 2-like [Actinia tenebrosa]